MNLPHRTLVVALAAAATCALAAVDRRTGDSQGNVSVIATESGGACGSAVLHITTNTENDWTVGKRPLQRRRVAPRRRARRRLR